MAMGMTMRESWDELAIATRACSRAVINPDMVIEGIDMSVCVELCGRGGCRMGYAYTDLFDGVDVCFGGRCCFIG